MKSDTKVIAILPVRDAGWILRKTLSSLLMWCDLVVVGLDSCTDDSEEICDEFTCVEKVFIDAENKKKHTGNLVYRQALLDHARRMTKNLIVVAIDSDEMFRLNGSMTYKK